MCGTRNSFWKCPVETSGQNKIWPASYESQVMSLEEKQAHKPALYPFRDKGSYLLGHDCSWLIINFTVMLLYLLLITNHIICPNKKAICPENGQLLGVILITACTCTCTTCCFFLLPMNIVIF